MALTVKYGPFHPHLERAFVEKLARLKAESPWAPVAVVAPSRRMVGRLERLAAVEGGQSLLNVHFHTFFSLAQRLLEEGEPSPKAWIGDSAFLDKTLDQLLEQRPELGALFMGVARPKALAKVLRASLKDLMDAGVSAHALAEHFAGELGLPPAEKERLWALLRLAEAYEKRLEELGLLASSGLTRLAAERAEGSRYLAGFKEILYYGFYDLTGLQLEFFEAVTAAHPCVLFFPYERARPAYKFAQSFFEEKLLRHEVEELSLSPGQTEGPALQVINASGARDEVWACAKEILRLVENEGYRYEDIGVAARTLAPYRIQIMEVFGENAIPYDWDPGEPLLRHPIAKKALNLLVLAERDFPAPMVEDLFCSPYFQSPRGSGPRTPGRWRELVGRLGIRSGWLQWEGKLTGPLPEDSEKLRPEREALWSWLSGLRRELSAPAGSWGELARSSRAVLERHLGLAAQPQGPEAEAWDGVLQALESMAAFDSLGLPARRADFLEVLEAKLKAASLASSPGCRGVRVRDAMEARGDGFKILFMIGLKEKLFPRPVIEDPLLRDSARAALRHPAGYWISRKLAGHEEEKLLFHLLVSSARERLYAVYPRSDEAGKAEIASLYLRELCRARGADLSDERVNRRISRQPAEKLRSCEPQLLSPKEFSLRAGLEGGLPPCEALGLAGFDGELLRESFASLGPLSSWGGLGPRDGLSGPPAGYLRSLREKGISPSALESFARCPFQFFADRVLELGRDESPSEKGEFAAWARGRIYHGALERFYKNIRVEEGLDWVPRLEKVVEEVFSEYGWKELGIYPVLWLSVKRGVLSRLSDFIAWDLAQMRESGLSPAWLEKSLSAPCPGELPEGLSGLRLRGIVDRLDLDETGRRFRVVDYKTRLASKLKIAGLVAKGEMYQLPIYAELAQAELGAEARMISACLIPLEASGKGGKAQREHVYEGGEWERDRLSFLALLRERLAEISQGRFPIRPDDGEFGHCRYCDFSALCRKSHGPTRRRAHAAESRTGGKE